jgi:Reverse transcriptase (RNA-dependent DNA polymerase)
MSCCSTGRQLSARRFHPCPSAAAVVGAFGFRSQWSIAELTYLGGDPLLQFRTVTQRPQGVRQRGGGGVVAGEQEQHQTRHKSRQEGTPQGASVSPLMANVYLHHVLDLWVDWWRRHHTRGEVIIVRFADDFICGFQHRADAQRFLVYLLHAPV